MDTVLADHGEICTKPLIEFVLTRSYDRDFTTLSKSQAKGYAKFITYFHLIGLADRTLLETWIKRVIQALSTHETVVTEIIISFGLTIAQYNEHTQQLWRDFIITHIEPMWTTNSSLSQRSRTRLWDVRDAFA